MSNYDDMFESIRGLAEQLQALNKKAVQAYAPIVADILRSRNAVKNNAPHL